MVVVQKQGLGKEKYEIIVGEPQDIRRTTVTENDHAL
jgi:hypothetical protein